jgi:hypothetical protein
MILLMVMVEEVGVGCQDGARVASVQRETTALHHRSDTIERLQRVGLAFREDLLDDVVFLLE